MEKAILKTLIYADIFNYPMTLREIHKWLIGKKANLRQVEKALKKLNKESRIKYQREYYFLRRRDGLVAKRGRRERQSAIYFRKAQILSQILKVIPWVRLVGVSGGLAVENAGKSDDIDLFIITSKNRLWISRLFVLGLLSLIGQRRKVGEKGKKIAGKICINTLLEEDRLEQRNKDVFVAHEVLQMKALWQRENIYSKYLMDNEWAFEFLPNWVGRESDKGIASLGKRGKLFSIFPLSLLTFLLNTMEQLARKFQLMIMKSPQGMERIEDGALYFHPKDCRLEVLRRYRDKPDKILR